MVQLDNVGQVLELRRHDSTAVLARQFAGLPRTRWPLVNPHMSPKIDSQKPFTKEVAVSTGVSSSLPYFLESFENLVEHFAAHFEALSSNERGDKFLALAQKIIPFTEEGQRFPAPEPSEKKSHDKGVDLITAEDESGHKLCAQSKFKISSKDELDTIISKFRDYESKSRVQRSRTLFDDDIEPNRMPVYMIVTSSKLDGIIAAYDKSELASKPFYQTLQQEKRLHRIDGPRILSVLQTLYRKTYVLPSVLTMRSVAPWISVGNVYIGILKAADLVLLYQEHGDALFFENIRDFLGISSGKKETEGRETVNAKIIDTINTAPPQMLARNNGITFRAESVTTDGDCDMSLSGAAIVNGCQTTMCLWHQRDAVLDSCCVAVKVVVTDDAWEVAKSANYQNAVAQIDLDLARYLRPQLIQRAATMQGYGISASGQDTINNVLDEIHQKRIEYDEMKCLYLGLFSRKPNNLFADNYAELRSDVLQGLYKNGSKDEERIFSTVFLIVTKTQDASTLCSSIFSGAQYEHFFKRFHAPDKPRYRAYIAILALCGALDENLGKRETGMDEEVARMETFLTNVRSLLENDYDRFQECYVLAYEVLASTALQAWNREGGNDSQVSQEMHKRVSQASFEALLVDLQMRIDAEKRKKAVV